MSEHTGCPRVLNLLINIRTVLTFPLIRWLNWNNAYHAEHHALGDLHQTMGPLFEEVRHGYVETQVHLIRNGLR
jgi:fatty acid desaturase